MKISIALIFIFIACTMNGQELVKRYFKRGEFTRTNGYKFKAKKVYFKLDKVEFLLHNRMRIVPLKEVASFEYRKGNYVVKGLLAGLVVGGIIAFTSNNDSDYAPLVYIIAPLTFGVLGTIIGWLSKKKVQIAFPNKHFSSRKEILINFKLEPNGIGFLLNF